MTRFLNIDLMYSVETVSPSMDNNANYSDLHNNSSPVDKMGFELYPQSYCDFPYSTNYYQGNAASIERKKGV